MTTILKVLILAKRKRYFHKIGLQSPNFSFAAIINNIFLDIIPYQVTIINQGRYVSNSTTTIIHLHKYYRSLMTLAVVALLNPNEQSSTNVYL